MNAQVPTESQTRAEKARLIRLAKPELRAHGLVDLTDFVQKKSSHEFSHPGFVRSLAYKMEEKGLVEVIPLKEWTEFYVKRANWTRRHPYLHAAGLGAVGVLFSILAGLSVAIAQHWIERKADIQRQTKQVDSTSVINSRDSTGR